MYRCQIKSSELESSEDIGKRRMVKIELGLSRTVKYEILPVGIRVESGEEPIQVGFQIFEAVEKGTVGTQFQTLHHLP